MARNPRYDPLFEPLRIGPVTAPNRFYQVPHCSGMGYVRPQMLAAMRGVKAEGGWGVVCTEYCSIHPSSDETPYPSASLRDEDDVRNLRLMTDAIHAQGSLAGVELWYGGHSSANLLSREVSLDVASLPNEATLGLPVQSQAMSLDDIARFRQMYRDAARSKPVSISSTSTAATSTCCTISCRAVSTAATTITAVRSETARACCAK